MKTPHGCELRRGRVSIVNQIYLITTSTHRVEPVFDHFGCARPLIRVMAMETGRVHSLAFVVMPDHLHWLLRLGSGILLEDVIQTVKSVSSHRINTMLGRKGRLWQPGFHDHALRREESISAVARYVIENPVRSGLVGSTGEYPHWDSCWID